MFRRTVYFLIVIERLLKKFVYFIIKNNNKCKEKEVVEVHLHRMKTFKYLITIIICIRFFFEEIIKKRSYDKHFEISYKFVILIIMKVVEEKIRFNKRNVSTYLYFITLI